ncbi:unnamed protein product [Orchesella dallaii]|uniref:Uncharacterized protein n=1 Tax=Orchesella dallaii TaxID=48710 RepID=A0ABP1QBD3_9HEXA
MADNQVILGAGDASIATGIEPQPVSTKSPPPDDIENSVHPFVKALHYDLVADKLVSFLNLEDMKALSAVSVACLTAVRKTKEFADLAKLVVAKDVIESGLLKESTYLWKHVSLDLTLPIEVVGLIEDILEPALSLSLTLHSPKDDKEVAQFLCEVFAKTKNLQSLTIDVYIMNKILHDVFSDVAVQSLLCKIDSLIIQGFEIHMNSTCYIDGSEDDAETPFQRNFFQLSLLPLNLKKFVFGKVCAVSSLIGTDAEGDYAKFVPKIVEATKGTLEELTLHFKVWSFEEMQGIRCPKLKRLTISANGGDKDKKIVETFLKNQPPLEELSLEISDGFPVSILRALQGRLSKVKKFHLKTKFFVGFTGAVDWTFLESMGELKDFYIRKPYSNDGRSRLDTYGYGEDILSKLPPSTEKISLIGFDSFWRDDFANQPEPMNNIGKLMERCVKLKELNLLRSGGSLNNEGLQSIIQTFPKLTSFEFSHCYLLSGFGLTGINKDSEGVIIEDTGFSLKTLKGLTKLTIRSCPNVNPDEILSVAEFPHLRSFDYYRNVDLPKETLLQIVRQNPCLEELSLHTRSYDSEYVNLLKKEVRDISQRVHKVNILEQSNWEDEDSDSDASSVHVDGESDFSGGGYDPNDYDDYDDYGDYDSSHEHEHFDSDFGDDYY